MRMIAAGLGSFGKSWAEIVRDSASVELAGVIEPSATGRAWAETTLGMPAERCYRTIDEAIAGGEFDAVLVVTPPETHLAVATAALRSGKHVLTEKPLTPTLAEAQLAIAEADAAERVLMVSQNYRFRPAVRAIRKAIGDGAIGRVLAVRLDCQRDWRHAYEPDNFRYLMKHPWVIDMTIHHWDLMRAMLGENVRTIDAKSWRSPDSRFVHDPNLSALVTFESGVTLTYTGSGATYRPLTPWNGDWEFTGELGCITWTGGVDDPDLGVVTLHRWGEPPIEIAQDRSGLQNRPLILDLFRQAVETGIPPETSAHDNIHSLALVLTCVASIERGEPVDVATVFA